MTRLKYPWFSLLMLGVILLFAQRITYADAAITKVCPSTGIQARATDFKPGGIILTSFDKSAIWVYNIDNGRRYPLPDTAPCTSNCHLSPDSTWLTFFNDPTNTFNIMHLDGTQRALVVENAAEVEWWNPTTYLVWTPAKQAYLVPTAGGDKEYLNVDGVISVQPGGRFGLEVKPKDDFFERWLINLQLRGIDGVSDQAVDLGADKAYFDAQSWSPDGKWLGYVAPVPIAAGSKQVSGEIFGIKPGDTQPTQWTQLTSIYGAERINGVAVGELSWSPDSSKIAFWVTPITGANFTANLGSSVIHILDVNTGALTSYCGFATNDQTPNPSRLVWSPDGTTLAFAGALPNDKNGYYLLAMDVASGAITSLTQGVFPVFGVPDVVAWGNHE